MGELPRDANVRTFLTPEEAAARKKRSAWTAIALFAFVILVFAVTIAKLGPENLRP